MNTGQCRSCGAELIWATTTNGKAMPLDAEPMQYGGNVRLHEDGTCEVLSKVEPRMSMEKCYRSHFASCKSAAKHRKPKK